MTGSFRVGRAAPLVFLIPFLGSAVIATAVITGRLVHHNGITIALTMLGSTYFVAAALLLRAGRRGPKREARVWKALAAGSVSGGVGWLSYAWLMLGGLTFADHAPTWLGIPRFGMYTAWFYAMWLLRQPLVAETRKKRVTALMTEFTALGVIGITVLSAMWRHDLTVSVNLIALVPVASDLVLIAAAYRAVRRSSLSFHSSHVWLVLAFTLALFAHISSVYVMAFGLVVTGAISIIAMAGALACMVVASEKPLRTRETIVGSERVTTVLATIALAVAPVGVFVAVETLLPVVMLSAALLAWRIHHMLAHQGNNELDPLTGLNDARSLERHVGAVISRATTFEPVGVIAVDLDGFGRWNAEHGFAAGDELLIAVADRCVSAPVGPGAWGRLGPDRFCWVGNVTDAEEARNWAKAICLAASDTEHGVTARCGVVLCPADASASANVMAAIDEALDAAAHTGRAVIEFDRGLLNGASVEGTYSASFRSRRENIAGVIQHPTAIRSFFQPITRLDDLAVVGHEILTRFELEPRRGPDVWIAEAHQLGLGIEMESACLRRAFTHAGRQPDGTYLSVNASPLLILSGVLERLVPDGALDWLLVEITEHELVSDYGELAQRLDGMRNRGARVAVDDLGAGHSTLRHLVRLAPDYAKLDRSIVEGIDGDPARRALVRSMLAFSTEMGCCLVAEGVERHEELETLREIGVQYGQGYLFRRPAPEMLQMPRCVPNQAIPARNEPHPVASVNSSGGTALVVPASRTTVSAPDGLPAD